MPLSMIGSSAFEKCENLHSVIFPENAVELKDFAFKNCSIASLIVTLKQSDSCSEVFANCTQLKNAVIRGFLGIKMFSSCTALTNISVEGNIIRIPMQCFASCSSLKSIDIYSINSILYIDDGAFSGCASLENFALENTNATLLGA